MANTTVKTVIDNAKLILQETTDNGIRWTNEELLGWLGEAYQKIISFKPSASANNSTVSCVAGTKQSLPADGVYLLDVVRNMAGSLSVVTRTERSVLDATRRGWHGDTGSDTIDHYLYDDQNPENFYVYPPATINAQLEVVYASVPGAHPAADMSNNAVIKLDDRYAPTITDYILMRAYTKDADFAGNAQRMQYHENLFMTSMGLKLKSEHASSPNNPQNK